jgi:polar amino acid transport system substrate-binding protein
MNSAFRISLATVALFASACATVAPPASTPSPEVAAALAPTGKLRVGVYSGSPTSYIAGEGSVKPRGVGYELGAKLAEQAHLPFEPLVFASNDKVLEDVKEGKVDLVLTNATPVRAQFIDFTPTVLVIEKGYLVPPGSSLKDAGIDRTGVRVGVSRGSSSEGELKQILRNASLVVVPSIDEGIRALSDGRLDAFATNKAILFGMSDRLPGSRVLDGRWGGESIAFGLPKGRATALPYVIRFIEEEIEKGGVRAAAERAGLRGLSTQARP